MTNNIVFRSIEEFMTGYTPRYTPLMPLFLQGARQHAPVVGEATYKKIEAVGDIRSRIVTPKDTELHQIGAAGSSKTYKKYFLGSQYIQSNLQDRQGYEDVVSEALDEHFKHNDEIFLSGGGQNNGLLVSSDVNFTTRASAEMALGSNANLDALYAEIIAEALVANEIEGQKVLLYFGDTMSTKMNSLYGDGKRPFNAVLGEAEALQGYDMIKVPTAVVPASLTNGFAIVNMNKIQVHYMVLPEVNNQGVNEEKNYAWTNFLQGSSMVDVKTKDGIILQPLTFAVA